MSWPRNIRAGHPQSAGFAARQPIMLSVTAGGAGGFRLVSSVSRSREARLWELPEFFDVRFRPKKYAGHIFRTESEALAERPAEEGLEGQEPRGTRRVED